MPLGLKRPGHSAEWGRGGSPEDWPQHLLLEPARLHPDLSSGSLPLSNMRGPGLQTAAFVK